MEEEKKNIEPMKMNREQKRAYKKAHAHDKYSNMCPYCKMKTRWKNDDNEIYCEVCGNMLFKIPQKEEEVKDEKDDGILLDSDSAEGGNS